MIEPRSFGNARALSARDGQSESRRSSRRAHTVRPIPAEPQEHGSTVPGGSTCRGEADVPEGSENEKGCAGSEQARRGRQVYDEHAARVGHVPEHERTLVRFDGLLRKSKPNPVRMVLPCLHEALEQPLRSVRRKSSTLVTHLDEDTLPFKPASNDDSASSRRELHRMANEVGERGQKPRVIARHAKRRFRVN